MDQLRSHLYERHHDEQTLRHPGMRNCEFLITDNSIFVEEKIEIKSTIIVTVLPGDVPSTMPLFNILEKTQQGARGQHRPNEPDSIDKPA